jgi:hypothetical protein
MTENSSTQSTVEIVAEEPWLLKDPLIEEESSPAAIARKGEDLACTPTLPPSPPTTKTRHRLKSYDWIITSSKRASCKSWCAKKFGNCWQWWEAQWGCNTRLCRLPKGVVAVGPPQAIDEFKRSCLLGPSDGDFFASLLGGLRWSWMWFVCAVGRVGSVVCSCWLSCKLFFFINIIGGSSGSFKKKVQPTNWDKESLRDKSNPTLIRNK